MKIVNVLEEKIKSLSTQIQPEIQILEEKIKSMSSQIAEWKKLYEFEQAGKYWYHQVTPICMLNGFESYY